MDEDQKVQEENQETQPEIVQETPTFSPIPVKTAKPKRTKTFLGIFILVIFVIGGFLIFKDNKTPSEEATPTPVAQGISISDTETPVATASPKPVDRTEISVEILNGTGITGEAAYLQNILKKLGYSDFKIGNSAKQDNVTTVVTFKKETSQGVQDEIVAELKEYYKEVDIKSSLTQTNDVSIVTGLKKGATAKPTASPTATPTTSPSPTATATATATPE